MTIAAHCVGSDSLLPSRGSSRMRKNPVSSSQSRIAASERRVPKWLGASFCKPGDSFVSSSWILHSTFRNPFESRLDRPRQKWGMRHGNVIYFFTHVTAMTDFCFARFIFSDPKLPVSVLARCVPPRTKAEFDQADIHPSRRLTREEFSAISRRREKQRRS